MTRHSPRCTAGTWGRVFLRRLGPAARPIAAADVSAVSQDLDLWRGALSSSFTLDGEAVVVRTAVHPTLDALAVDVCSPLVHRGGLGLGLAFPYGSTGFAGGQSAAVK